MTQGICIFAEHWKREISAVVYELITAAKQLKEVTGEPVQLMLAAKDCQELLKQLEGFPVDEIYVAKLEEDYDFQEDVLSDIYEQMLRSIQPSCVLIPASDVGRSLFPRVACRLRAGMTADCTELEAAKREDGSFYLRQIKPSFEENVKVCICCKEQVYPQMATVREGVYEACEAVDGDSGTKVQYLEVSLPEASGIQFMEELSCEDSNEKLQASEIVVVGGKGTLKEDNFRLMCQFADKLGAAVGGTRPLMDEGKIPFDHQIGQTGCTIRPKICISFGVSGAIQHTEGIKNTDLFLAVNTAEDAPIFQVADYGAVADMKPILQCLLEMIENGGCNSGN